MISLRMKICREKEKENAKLARQAARDVNKTAETDLIFQYKFNLFLLALMSTVKQTDDAVFDSTHSDES